MKFKKITISEAVKKMELWKADTEYYIKNELDHEYNDLRKQLIEAFDKIPPGHKYRTDYSFGMHLYGILKKHGFTLRDASDDDKWRYLSLCVVPDVVAKRWGKNAEIRYFRQSNRLWLKTIWWYIHLGIQNTFEDTKKVLEKNTTDEIQSLVDRIGRNGYRVDVYRKIVYYYWVARQINPKVGSKQFRNLMVLHTALSVNIIPELYGSGIDDYVQMLFSRIGVELNET